MSALDLCTKYKWTISWLALVTLLELTVIVLQWRGVL